jgi:hypothetical protein
MAKTFGPTANYHIVAEQLTAGNRIPLGKYLLGAVYHLLHQVAVILSTDSPIGIPGGSWWFINMWLTLYSTFHWSKTFLPRLSQETNQMVSKS